MIRFMTQPPQTDAPDVERIPLTRGEKVAGWVGLAVVLVLGLICFDLATGGKITARFAAPAKPAEQPCEDC